MMPETPVLTSTGRTVREAVESASGAFSDASCRRLIADLLHAVERQQALHTPHRIIMPDTVMVQADGAAELLAPLDEDDAPLQPPVAADLKAIAAVAHFAISGESPPAGALLPRGLAFEDDLLQAIDACLYGDRNTRPQTVEDMRRLLGMPPGVPAVAPATVEPAIVAPAFVEPVTAAPAPAPASMADELEQAIAGLAAAVGVRDDADAIPHEPPPAPVKQAAPQADRAAAAEPVEVAAVAAVAAPAAATTAASAAAVAKPPPRASRWLLACLAVGLLGAGGLALYQKGRQAGAEAVLAAAAQPGAEAAVQPAAPAPAAAVPAAAAVPPIADPAPVAAVPPQQTPPAAASTAAAATPAGRPPSVTYQLRIKPWGEIWVDGVKRGVSPPLKTLTLSGVHRVRIDNPDFPSQEMTVGTAQDTSNRIDYDFR